MASGSRKAGLMAGISRIGGAPTKSFSERPRRSQRPFWRLRTHPERPAPLDYRRPSTGRRIVVHQRMTTASERSQLRDGVMPVQHGLEAMLLVQFDLG